MTTPHDDSWSDDWIEKLVQFDEALRMGRRPASGEPLDPELEQAQDFLMRMQSLWPRAPKKIGPYTLVRSLGQGTVGPCFLVEDPATRQPFTLKILWPDLSAHPQVRQQLVQQADRLRQLRHPGIAALREVREAGSLCYVVSEYCPGMSLAQWRLKKPQPLDSPIALALGIKLADILDAAHGKGIRHGDLKPANIFLTHAVEITPTNLDQAAVRIADFALANSIQQARFPSQQGLVWPMPQYLAPEQLSHRNRPTEPASDVYALGVLLYELLTGRCPVAGSTREEICAHTRAAAPPPLRQYRPEIPESVEAVVLRCLHKKPRDRFTAMPPLADALRRQLPGSAAEPEKPAWWKNWLGWM